MFEVTLVLQIPVSCATIFCLYRLLVLSVQVFNHFRGFLNKYVYLIITSFVMMRLVLFIFTSFNYKILLMNLQQFFEKRISLDEKLTCMQHHVNKGFAGCLYSSIKAFPIEKLIKEIAGKYATGDEVQLADVFLAPQIYAGVARYQIDMSLHPTLARLNEAYAELPAFQAAHPHRQPDAPSTS
ncbi:hypothetical protein GW17_00045043 [Ensete ventricosum]|nr:hypothetical protein GW17_00045043 [Ensete ventricosum]